MKTMVAQATHKDYIDDLKAVLTHHQDALTGTEMLALTAHLVGCLIACQDQRSITKQMALEMVIKNIEQGNKDALEAITATAGNA